MIAQTPSLRRALPVLSPLSPLPLVRPFPAHRRDEPLRPPIPAVLWRESLSVTAGRLDNLEGWAAVALIAFTLPAVALSQSGLWQLLTTGALDRAVRAFMLVG